MTNRNKNKAIQAKTSPASAGPDTRTDPGPDPRPQTGFPVVGIGASAGGLEVFEAFFRLMPPASGIAFVLVSHLSPDHASMLSEILQRNTAMPVVEAVDQTVIEPDRVYVIPPNRDMAVFHGILQLSLPEDRQGQRMPIDFFFRSLAEDKQELAVGMIFSGNGTDGTLGLRAILGAGGVSFVQEPSTAQYEGMPESAVQNGFATYVLPVSLMPERLVAYVKTLAGRRAGLPALPIQPPGSISKILMLLRSRTGHDFSLYKQNTVHRRIERRMTVRGITDPVAYVRYLQDSPDEVQSLFKELLINVTSFFRDPEAFQALKQEVLPKLAEGKPEGYSFRVWVAGCSSGEEAYSLAIIFREFIEESNRDFSVQIYATDLDADAIVHARAAVYPPNIAMDVSPERLGRYFRKDDGSFRVNKDIREMVVFALQDITRDPPFTKLDILCCRNLLIYLEGEMQDRLIPLFRYALKEGGVLFLGSSEGIGRFTDVFAPLLKKIRVFQARGSAPVGVHPGIGARYPRNQANPERIPGETGDVGAPSLVDSSRAALLQAFAPASVITDGQGTILYVHGDTGRYLRPAKGRATLNVVEMARDGLSSELGPAMRRARDKKTTVTRKEVEFRAEGGVGKVHLVVRPVTDGESAPGNLIISFQDIEPPGRKTRSSAGKARPSRRSPAVEELRRELAYVRENLQATIEELQSANEEMQSANEESKSTNEELQSTNEELVTSREELQSVNEELVTVNAELQAKIEQLSESQNDLKNLLDGTNIITIFLDDDLVIRRFTRQAASLFRLVPTDAGRHLGDIKADIPGDVIIEDARAVLDTLVPREREMKATGGAWFTMRIMPYRTLDNVIDGIVLTFSEITRQKLAEAGAIDARDFAESIVDTVLEPLMVLDPSFKVLSASRSFFNVFRVSPRETVGHDLFTIGKGQWDIPRLRTLLEKVLPRDLSFSGMAVEHDFPSIGRKRMLLNARRMVGKTGDTQLILLAMQDVTATPRPADELLLVAEGKDHEKEQ